MSFITISKSAFFHNLSLIEQKVKDKNKIAIVIKDNAYGHDITLISKLASQYGIKKAIVRDIDEANTISKYFDEIITLNSCTDKVNNKISQVINNISDINKIQINSKIELKVDTNMHRNGISLDELQKALQLIQEKNLILNGVMTHFSSSDLLDNSVFLQQQNFKIVKKITKKFCKNNNIKIPLFHSCNSSATFRLNNIDDFVRVGISIYGYIYLDKSFNIPNLKPIISLWANKISQRELKKGDKVGYGQSGIIQKDMIVSSYDVGYSDGMFRLNQKHNYTTPNGSQIIGKISMDNFSANSSEDTLCIFNDVSSLSNIFDTITYDVLVKLKKYIKRVEDI
jgi:alanine racemase